MPRHEKRVPLGPAVALGLALAARGGLAQVEEHAKAVPPAVTVAFELVVEDARGQPVTDLRLDEVEVVQDATRQKVRTFETGPGPGATRSPTCLSRGSRAASASG